jgi:hypothetical protein
MLPRGRPPDCKFVYKDADEFFVINDGDKELEPVRISLPKPPPLRLIDGYNLPHEEQYFRRLDQLDCKHTRVAIDTLKDVERAAANDMRERQKTNKNYIVTPQKLLNAFWEEFERRRDPKFDKTAEFLKEVHWMREYGYWFFNDGKPTYITGDHFDYLNYWTFVDEKTNDEGRPEYRDIDRKVYLFRKYGFDTTESVTVKDDQYVVEDIGIPICFGTAEPKSRRCGITTQAIHTGMKTCMTGSGKYFTIVSMDGNNAEVHYDKKLLPAFKDYPIWLKPNYAPQIGNSIVFDVHSRVLDDDFIGSVIDYTDSAGERKNDGDKLHYGLMDEEGKTDRSDVNERWTVNRQAMALGERRVGFSMHPTTVEEMDVGGEQYMKMCNQSKFYERIEGGQTVSGLFEIFVPAYERYEGFFDRFGMSVVDTPTERQIRLRPTADFARFKKGAKELLQNKLDILLEIGTPEALEKHRSLRRKYPMKYADCWIGSSGDLGFDMDIIDDRLAALRRNNIIRVGRFEWTQGFGSDVQFIDDHDGPFEVSMLLKPGLANKRVLEDYHDPVDGEWREQRRPVNEYKFTGSADAFKHGTSNEAKKMGGRTRQSDGGLAVLWEYDESIDGDNEDSPQKWKSHRFVCSYRYRPTSLDEYQEDALKMCVYYGAMMYPERNVGDIDVYFIKVGYGGYLMYDIDPETGKRAERAGFASYERKKGQLFAATKDYIRFHGHKEEHASYLEECKSIQGVEQMNKYDRFTAHGGCLLGSKQNYYNRMRGATNTPSSDAVREILDFFDTHF